MRHLFGVILLTSIALGVVAGCGGGGGKGPTGKVSGVVTFDGQPVTVGSVRLYNPKSASTGSGSIKEAGKFTLDAPVPVGSYKVSVVPPQEPPPEMGKPYEPKKYDNIPDKYRSELTTDITAEIKAGDNEIKVEMKK